MIAQLTGELVESTLGTAVVDVNGVGYEAQIPLSTAEHLPQPHSRVTLFTYLAVREDALTLYGFLTHAEKQLFELVLENVKGFGPKLALNVISSMSVSAFCAAVANQDLKLLSKISGVGKKSAAQLLLDLKGKLGGLGGGAAAAQPGAAAAQLTPAAKDAVAALETLGFKRDDAQSAIQALLAEKPDLSSESLIRQALARMSGHAV